jgi:CheY-like chemotaxis protein
VEAQDTGQDPAKHEGALRVLVVDDNIDVAEVLSELVKIAGHHADIAYTGPCAIEAARKNRPDVMLLDIGLPGMDGCEVARRVRDELGDMGPVMVALTGYGGEADVLRTKQAGFHHHLVKPAEWTELERILAGVSPRAR